MPFLRSKASLLISKTGESVMQLQLDKQRADVKKFDDNFSTLKVKESAIDPTDFATNGDLVELVGELQGELSHIEERAIRRTINSTKTDSNDTLAPMPNLDGDIPTLKEKHLFVATLGKFENIGDEQLYRLAKFYERLPPAMKEEEDFAKIVSGKVEEININEISDAEIREELKKYSKEELNEIFNEVARYLGVRCRRGANIW